MFLTPEANEAGIYAAFMAKNGKKIVVLVDDQIPCKDNRVAFARANGPELWVILLEKMWAKLHGSYDRIAGGREYETIRDLTGAPGYFFSEINDESFEQIYDYDNQGFLMSCSVGPDYTQEEADNDGIVLGHAYTLLSVAQIQDKRGNMVRLVKLRNPWGSGEWKGNWSDKSDSWTNKIRE